MSAFIDIRAALPASGFLADWLKFTEDFEYPESFSVFSLLVAASCAVDGRITVNPGAKPETRTNLYCILYGPSGSRKSEALLDAVDLLAEAIPEAPALPMNFTMEALRGRLHDDSERFGRAAGLILAEELSTLLGGRDYLLNNSLFLSKVWDGRPRETFLTIAHKEQIIKNSYITLGACSTPDAMMEMDPKGLSSGLLRRIITIHEYGPRKESARPVIPVAFKEQILIPEFRRRLGPTAFTEGAMVLSPEARRMNEEWYQTTLRTLRHRHVGQREAHFVNTMQVHAFKLGALVHLLEGGDPGELNADSMQIGFKLVEAITPGTFEMYRDLVPTPLAKLRALVTKAAANGQPIRDKDLDEAVWMQTGVSPEAAAAARINLLEAGVLVRQSDGRILVNR